MRRLMVVFAAAALVFGAAACGEDTPETADQTTEDQQDQDPYGDSSPAATSQAQTSGDADVEIVDFGFEPKELTVAVGEEVVWKNTGEAPHTVTFKAGGIDSGSLEPSDAFSHEFDAAGSTEYFCSVHGEERMSGTVTAE